MDVPSLKYIGGREILLFGGEIGSMRRADGEVASFVLVNKSAEDRW